MASTSMVIYSRMIPAWKWTRSTALPASTRRATPETTPPTPPTTRCLLERLRGVENRTARFVCVIALVRDGKLVKTFRGAVEGRIIDEARGSGGFGYDPLFYYEPFGCTFGEAAIEQKMQVSHRAQALAAMFTYLAKYRFHLRKPTLVLASMILPVRIISSISFAVNQRVAMRSSSIGLGSPAVRPVAR